MKKCDCCGIESDMLTKYKDYEVCPSCFIGYINKDVICEHNKNYERRIAELENR